MKSQSTQGDWFPNPTTTRSVHGVLLLVPAPRGYAFCRFVHNLLAMTFHPGGPQRRSTSGMATSQVAALLIALLSMLASSVIAATRHVPSEYATIQDAVFAAASGDTVLVAPGTYRENITINLPVTLIGEAGAAETTVDGQDLGSVIHITDSGHHTIVTGFRITGGHSQLWGGGIDVDSGFITSGYVVMRQNIIEHNRSDYGWGGVRGGQNCTFEDNLVQYNDHPLNGDSISAFEGQGTIKRNIFRNNGSLGSLGTVLVHAGSVFTDNLVVNNGGAVIAFVAFFGGGVIRNNTIANNLDVNGTLSNVRLKVNPNVPTDFGSNIIAHGNAPGVSCDFRDGASYTIRCNDVWGSGAHFVDDCDGTLGLDHNFSADPLFCFAQSGDYRLNAASPCAPLNAPEGCGLIGALDVCGITAIAESSNLSRPRLRIGPNPVRRTATFTVEAGLNDWAIDIYDAEGRLLETLAPRGNEMLWIPPPTAANGVYFARLWGPGVSEVVKFLRIR